MTVSTREFLRRFPTFRRAAEEGKEVIIATREGAEFIFQRVGSPPRPRQAEMPLPKKVTDQWQVDSAAFAADEWGMQQ